MWAYVKDGAIKQINVNQTRLEINPGSYFPVKYANEWTKEQKEASKDVDFQLSFFDVEDPKMQEIRKIIEDLDIDNLSPVEALIKLNQIKKEIKDED